MSRHRLSSAEWVTVGVFLLVLAWVAQWQPYGVAP